MPPKDTTTAAAATRTAPKVGEHSDAVNDLLEFAQTLADEKADVYERINANREILRNYSKMGLLSNDQRGAIEAFYPAPKKKADAAAAEAPAAA